MNFDTFVAIVSKAMKDYESELDVGNAHNFLSSDGTFVTADDLIKYGNTIKLNLSDSDWKNLVEKLDSTDQGRINLEDFTQGVLGEDDIV